MPPGRFSTTSGWPRRTRSSSPRARMNTSLMPPALVVVSTRIGRDGKSCAAAGAHASVTITDVTHRLSFMRGLSIGTAGWVNSHSTGLMVGNGGRANLPTKLAAIARRCPPDELWLLPVRAQKLHHLGRSLGETHLPGDALLTRRHGSA